MKKLAGLAVCALSLLAFASTAQSKTAQANGTFDFELQGATGSVVFDAAGQENGSVTGQMSFHATVEVDDGNGGTVPANVTLGVDFDCLVVDGNRAAMSGPIPTPPTSPARQALLIVEDHVVGVSPDHDGFAWGVYEKTPLRVNLKQSTENDFGNGNRYKGKDYDFCPDPTPPVEGEEVVTDVCEGECPSPPACIDDPGITLTWNTADAELYPCPLPTEENPNPVCPVDPNGYTVGLTLAPTGVSCDSFPIAAYPLNLIPKGGGNKIQVTNNP